MYAKFALGHPLYIPCPTLLFELGLALVFILSDVLGLAHLLLHHIASGDIVFLTFLLSNGCAFSLGYLVAFS